MVDDKEEITYELECTECGAEYEIVSINTSKNEPIYCPYCGADIDLEDLEEEEVDELDYDEDDYNRDWLW